MVLEWWWFFHNRIPWRERINLEGVRRVVFRIDQTNDEDLILERDNPTTLDRMPLNENVVRSRMITQMSGDIRYHPEDFVP